MQKRWLKSPQLWDPGVGGHARNVQVFLIRRDLSQQDQNDNLGLAWPKVRLEEMNITRVYGISWVIRSFHPTRMLSSQPEKEVKKVHRLQTLALMCQPFPVGSGDTTVPGTPPIAVTLTLWASSITSPKPQLLDQNNGTSKILAGGC